MAAILETMLFANLADEDASTVVCVWYTDR